VKSVPEKAHLLFGVQSFKKSILIMALTLGEPFQGVRTSLNPALNVSRSSWWVFAPLIGTVSKYLAVEVINPPSAG